MLETLPYDTGPAGNQYPQANLATLVSQGASQPAASLPSTLGQATDLAAEPIAQRREIVFSRTSRPTCTTSTAGRSTTTAWT